MKSNKKFRIGIASFAHMHAWSYLTALQSFDDVEIIAIAEENIQNQSCIKEFPYNFYDKYSKLCKDPEIDCILITTENNNHAKVAIEALNEGKHVIVEKPIATTLEDAKKMMDAAEKSQGILVQCYPCRYHPTSLKIKEIVDNGDFGKILCISSTNHGKMPSAEGVYAWFSEKDKAGGGALMDHITHVADFLFWIMGSNLKSIYATSDNLFHPDRDVEDSGMVLMEFENGVKVSLDPSWNRPENYATWGDVTMTIFGTEGTLNLDMFAQNLDIQSNDLNHPIWLNYGSDIDKAMLRDFIENLKQNKPPMLSGLDGYKALEVVIAAYESIEKNQKIFLNGKNTIQISSNIEDLLKIGEREKEQQTTINNKISQNIKSYSLIKELFTLKMTRFAYEKCMTVVKAAFEATNQAVESYWLLLGDKIVKDIVVPKQNVSFAHVHVDLNNILEMKDTLHNQPLDVIGWGHSHANFGVFFSGTDKRNQERILHETNNYADISKIKNELLKDKEQSSLERESKTEDKKLKKMKHSILNNDDLIKFSYGCTFNVGEDTYAEIILTDSSKEIKGSKIALEIIDSDLSELEKVQLKQFRESLSNIFK